MPAGLQFVVILPDGSKSLIPADWTDFKTPSGASQAPQLVGSLDVPRPGISMDTSLGTLCCKNVLKEEYSVNHEEE
jgi:hypothetical protein